MTAKARALYYYLEHIFEITAQDARNNRAHQIDLNARAEAMARQDRAEAIREKYKNKIPIKKNTSL